MAGSVGMIIANIAAVGITIVVMYGFITYLERKTRINYDIARDLSGK